MHDGKTKTLADVVHYLDRGGTANPNLDALVKPLNLTVRKGGTWWHFSKR